MNYNFEGILPVGFPVDAPYDEKCKLPNTIAPQVSVNGAGRRWVRVMVPESTPVIEAVTGTASLQGMPCRYLAAPTFYKGLISYESTPFPPGIPVSLQSVNEDYFLATYLVKTRVSTLRAISAIAGAPTYAMASARLTRTNISVWNSEEQMKTLIVAPTLCQDGVIVIRRTVRGSYLEQSTSFSSPSDFSYESGQPQLVAIAKIATRPLRENDGLERFGMLFSLNVPISRFDTATASLAPALFSNAVSQLADDVDGQFDELSAVVAALPIAIQSENGAAAPASQPGTTTDLTPVVEQLAALNLTTTSIVTVASRLNEISQKISGTSTSLVDMLQAIIIQMTMSRSSLTASLAQLSLPSVYNN